MYRFFLAALLLASCLLLPGCGPEKKNTLKIGVSIPAPTHGWAAGVVWEAERAKARLERSFPDAEFVIVTAKDSSEQVAGIENLLMRGVNALVVMAQDPVPLSGVCKRAKKQGVFLTVVSNPLKEPEADLFVNGDNRSFGVEAARAMGALLQGKGDILVMEGLPCPINNDRVSGFRDTLAKEFPGIRILGSGEAGWNRVRGQELMENFLAKYPAVDGVWTGDDDVLAGALNAYKKSGRSEVRAMVGGGGAKDVLALLLAGDPLVRATVTYPPDMIGYGMEMTLESLRGKAQVREAVIPSNIITRENAADYYHADSPY